MCMDIFICPITDAARFGANGSLSNTKRSRMGKMGEEMKELKVYYKTKNRIDSNFDREITELANKYGLKWWASGWDYEDKVRDVCFDKKGKK